MPDHIHFIFAITGKTRATARIAPTVGHIVGAYKSIVANKYLQICKNKRKNMGEIFQRNYYDHIIRNENDLNEIRRYIETNPLKPEYIK